MFQCFGGSIGTSVGNLEDCDLIEVLLPALLNSLILFFHDEKWILQNGATVSRNEEEG